ncbi:MAG: adenylate/guanylate cyclase domain-containing protein [Spirulinaceae cyanobacterium SM2_1_0]|nr:adenylate/guanylate cyclase domain-containing protein [Spirulinaceae cyanobacterium SM2_1_0]
MVDWNKARKWAWQWRSVWLVTPSAALVVILLRFAGLLQPWEWAVYDQYLRLRPSQPPDDRIVIVGIDEADLDRIGQTVLPDRIYAELITRLREQEPVAIGLDVYRNRPVEPGHAELLEVYRTTPNLIGIAKVIGDRERETIPPPPLLADEGRFGANDLLIDADNTVRRALLSAQGEALGPAISFGMYLAGFYLDQEGLPPEQTETGDWKFGETVFPRFDANDGGYVRAETGGNQILLNYRGLSWHFDVVPVRDVLDGKIPDDWARDRLVLIGDVGEGSNDFFFTPYSSTLLSLPEGMAGVEIHANIASQIISTVLDDRPLIQSWAEPWEWLWILFWSGTGAILSWTMRYANGARTFSLRRFSFLLIAAGLLLGGSYGALLLGWWIPVVPPLLALMGSTVAITAQIARTAGDIRKTFGRYLTDAVVATLLENPEGMKMGGERRQITILTSDLRGFTALSERLSPEEVVKILNFYLGHMADTITHYQGTIDEFMGDGILVLFGAPTARPDDARRAIACAIAMQQAMTAVNTTIVAWGLPELEMGIGINTGEVVVGNIGSEKRTKYGVVGSQVNLTYRIESYTTGGQILVSEMTLREADAEVRIDNQKEVSPKGVKRPITIYEVSGIGNEYNLFLERAAEIFQPLTIPLKITYAVLDGKDISATAYQAQIVQLSEHGGEIDVSGYADFQQPKPLTNIKLNFLALADVDDFAEDVYAKVTGYPAAAQHFYIQFTAKPPAIARKLNEIYHALPPQNAATPIAP